MVHIKLGGIYVMINHWYISLSNDYPKQCKCVWLHLNHSLVEMTEEATDEQIDYCKLIYLGRGLWDDEHIQINYDKQTDLLNKGR